MSLVRDGGERAAVGDLALDPLGHDLVVAGDLGLEVAVLGVGLLAALLIAPSEPMPRKLLYCLPLTKTSSPGASSQPASSAPTMTVSAPATSALAISPEYLMPPSAITGTPAGWQASAAS